MSTSETQKVAVSNLVRSEKLGDAHNDELVELAEALKVLATGLPDLAERSERLAERLANHRFHIAVLGDFKRGKSTLVNALLGQPILPTGVIPLTSVATEMHVCGSPSSVVFKDGSRRPIVASEVDQYVIETENPSNAKNVERVEIGINSDFGVPGLVLVDTPGLSSVSEQNTDEALRALLDSDAAIVVLSADNPLSKSELDVLEQLGDRRAKVYVVINKVDHLSKSELDEVRRFVVERTTPVLGRQVHPYAVNARDALDIAKWGSGSDASEFTELKAALNDFVRGDLSGARRQAALSELKREVDDLSRSVEIEEAAAAFGVEQLDRQIARFNAAAEEGRRLLADDAVILGHDAESLIVEVGDMLSERAAGAARDHLSKLSATLETTPASQLQDRGADAVEELVGIHFERIRREVIDVVEERWLVLSERYAERVQSRVDALVQVARDLFDVHLPSVTLPRLADQRGCFSYHFVHIEGVNAPIGHFLSHFIPSALVRRRAVREARRRLFQEFDKHAGRARYDIDQRLHAAKMTLTSSMVAEFELTENSIVAACNEARARRALGAAVRSDRTSSRRGVQALVARIERALTGAPTSE